MKAALKNLQASLYSAITAEPGAVPERRLDSPIAPGLIRGGERMPAGRHVAIYAEAYFYRLLDCLKEDFPATLAVAGEKNFKKLVRSYLTKHPPTEPSIYFAGRYLADFLAHDRLPNQPLFLAELARLERALIEVFHGPDAPALYTSDINIDRPQDWPARRFHIQPALRTLDCEWRVHDVLRAAENKTQWKAPERAPVCLLIWRQDAHVYYREVDPAERAALETASHGAGFAVVCESFASWFDGREPAAAITRMLSRWLADGILTREGYSA